jgi:YidC/Oxa1 family membrane protein insertase
MSQQPQQPQKPNLMTMILVFLVVFLGLQLLMPKNRTAAPEKVRAAPEIVAEMEKLYAGDTAGKKAMDKLRADLTDLQKLDGVPTGLAAVFNRSGGKRSEERLQGWIIFAATLDRNGRGSNDTAGTKSLEGAEVEYRKIERSYPGQFQKVPEKYREMVGAATLDERISHIHGELNKRYAVAEKWGIGAGYQTLHFLVRATGAVPWFSYAFAVFLMAVAVRLLTYPFTQAQFRFMRKMKALQPAIEKLKERFEGRELWEKQAELFRRAGVNQLVGCLGMFAPLPFFIWVYHVMRAYRFEFEQGTFLWVNPTLSKLTGGLISPNLGTHDALMLLVYAVSMYITQRMMVMDPSQEKQQRRTALIMSAVFLVMMYIWRLPSAFVLYWLAFNILSTAQQVWVNRQPAEALAIELPELPEMFSDGKGKGVPKQHKQKSGAKKRRR